MAAQSTGGTGTRPVRASTSHRVLLAIRTAEQPPTVEDISSALGVHPNTVRQHVGILEADGLVVRDRRPTGSKGRPRAVYRPTSLGERSGDRNYQLLAGVLVEQLAATTEDAVPAARQAGRAWGTRLGGVLAADGSGAESLVVDFLEQAGFDPVPGPPGPVEEISLRNCPFRELADSHADLVCSLHEGLLEGLVQGGGEPARGRHVDLVPFATPTTCLVRVTTPEG